MYRESWPEKNLSLEEGTDSVPSDGRFHILLNGEVLGTYANMKKAQSAYGEKKRELGWTPGEPKRIDPQKLLREEAADRYLWEASADLKGRESKKSGGRGGRGGV